MICGNRSCDYGDEQLTGEEKAASLCKMWKAGLFVSVTR